MPARSRLRWTAYVGVSTALASGVVLKALAQRPNFYSAAVYLSQSSANLMIMTNLIFAVSCTFMLGLQKLLYGPLRPIEVEQLYEKAWFAVTETCLAMTIFRGEIGAWFLTMFFSLLVGKVWGWIGEGRVEVLEQQPPRNPRLFHTRLAMSLGLSVAYDLTLLEYVVKQVMRQARPDMMVMFGFEFAVLSIMSLSTAAKYAINLVEIGIVREQKRRRAEEMKKQRLEAATREIQEAERNVTEVDQNRTDSTTNEQSQQTPSIEAAREALRVAQEPIDENEVEVEGWDSKGRWIFYLDLMTDFLKLVVYLSFFFILLIFYGLPIHIMRDVFLTFRSFLKRISDFIKYRAATRDMNERYPDATADEIGRDDVCIICREELRPYQPPAPEDGQPPNPVAERMRPKKLPCGHILHFSCLRSWLERQQVCPTCRASVVPAQQGNIIQAVGLGGAGAGQGQNAGAQRLGQGARVFQLGPLRIGVGAHRGNNMFEELQQQLGDNRGAALPPANANGPQQYGFGIRWDGGGRRRSARRHRSIHEQLNDVSQQLQQELESLSRETSQLVVLRQMHLELERIRSTRQNQQTTTTSSSTAPNPINEPANMMNPLPETMFGHARGNRISGLANDAGENLITAGSDRVPEGMTLPEGWTLMPLQSSTVPPPPNMPGMPAFNRPPMPQTIWGPGMPAPVQVPPGMFQMPNINIQRPPNMQHHGHMPPPLQPQVSGVVPTTTVPSIDANGISNPSNRGSSIHQPLTAAHEAFHASLQPPASRDETTSSLGGQNGISPPTDGIQNHPTTTQRQSVEVNGTPEVPAGSSSIPQWGSSSGLGVDDSNTDHINTNGNAITAETDPEPASESRQPKNRSATVEDLVEDPD